MSNSISSTSHVSSAQPAAQAAAQQTAKGNPAPQAAKTSPVPQDTVKLSSQAQAAPPAKGTSDVDHDGGHH
jgi:hypothetical protein